MWTTEKGERLYGADFDELLAEAAAGGGAIDAQAVLGAALGAKPDVPIKLVIPAVDAESGACVPLRHLHLRALLPLVLACGARCCGTRRACCAPCSRHPPPGGTLPQAGLFVAYRMPAKPDPFIPPLLRIVGSASVDGAKIIWQASWVPTRVLTTAPAAPASSSCAPAAHMPAGCGARRGGA